MFKLFRYLLWLVVICALSLSFDQLMVSLSLTTPGLAETQKFYVDFRQRMINLVNNQKGSVPATTSPTRKPVAQPQKAKKSNDSIASVISRKAVETGKQNTRRYLYVDGQGDLQFADQLDQIPRRYRDSAHPLAE